MDGGATCAAAATGGVDDDHDAEAAVGHPEGVGAELLDDDAAACVVQTDKLGGLHVVAGRSGGQDLMQDIHRDAGIGIANRDAAGRFAVTDLCMRPRAGT